MAVTALGRTCSLCSEWKEASHFYSNGKWGLHSQCKECTKAKSRASYETNPEYYKDKKRRSLYQLEVGEFESMYAKQDGKCAICLREKKLVVDHSHETNKVRGLLCQSCNTALGKFQDDVDVLTSAISYLITMETNTMTDVTMKGDDLSP